MMPAIRFSARERVKAAHKRGISAGIVYAAGWLAHSHGEDTLAEEMLRNAGLLTRADCLKAGADPYDVKCCRRPLAAIAYRTKANAARQRGRDAAREIIGRKGDVL